MLPILERETKYDYKLITLELTTEAQEICLSYRTPLPRLAVKISFYLAVKYVQSYFYIVDEVIRRKMHLLKQRVEFSSGHCFLRQIQKLLADS